MILPGTTMIFFGAAPSSHFCASGTLTMSADMSATVADSGYSFLNRTLPFTETGTQERVLDKVLFIILGITGIADRSLMSAQRPQLLGDMRCKRRDQNRKGLQYLTLVALAEFD